jgi:hypothetical protein
MARFLLALLPFVLGRSFILRLALPLVALWCVAACKPSSPAPPAGHTTEAAAQQPSDSGTWLLGPEPESDLLHADATEASLRATFGAANVRTDSVYVGEGLSELGTILFPDDSTRRLSIVWEDTVARARPVYVYLTGPAVVWRLYPGVGIGTDLKTLEALNGRAFRLSGFAWDYSGTTGGFEGGRLDSLWRRGAELGDAALLRLDPSTEGASDTVMSQVLGDRLFPSSHPAMQRLNPRIYQILVRPR